MFKKLDFSVFFKKIFHMGTILDNCRLNMHVSLDVKGRPFSDYGRCSAAFFFVWFLIGILGSIDSSSQEPIKIIFHRHMRKEYDVAM